MTSAASASEIVIKPIQDRRTMRDFLDVPRRIYRDVAHWVAPLDFIQKQNFSPSNPFFQHARWQGWVAYVKAEPVGRITAQIDDLHQQRYQDDTGYFGMLEAADDAALFARLFSVAEDWLRQQGMRRIRGPYNLGVNQEVGTLVEGFDTAPFVMMGHGQPWYNTRMIEQAYQPAQDMFAYLVDTDFEAPSVMLRLAARVSDKVKIRPLRRKHLAEEAEIMRDIFNDAWQNNWGFVPFTEAEYGELVKTLTLLLPDEYVQIIEYEGRPAAFIVVLPNINEASRDLNGKLLPFGWLKLLWRLKVTGVKSARVPLMGVRQEFQNSRLGPTMAFMAVDAVRKAGLELGVERAEMGWILESNAAMRNIIETLGGVAYKRYRMYEKTLS